MKKALRVWQDLWCAEDRSVTSAVVLFIVVPAVVAVAYGAWWPLVLSAFAAAGLAKMVKTSWETVEVNARHAQKSAWAQWIDSSPNQEEADSRKAAAIAAGWAGLPPVNVDGVPMLDGSAVDIYGRVYGDSNDEQYNFDTFSTDAATGMPLDTFDAYSSPMGMDSHHNPH